MVKRNFLEVNKVQDYCTRFE